MISSNTLGRYQIVREIARSNDIVYEAVDSRMGRRVALKELQMPPNLAGAQRRERVERFYREARAAGTLTHPNIVTIYEVGEDAGRHFIAMEFLEGESLRDRLQKSSVLPLDEALRIAAAVADGLEFAHRHGVIHRDVKPDNVHMLPDGRVKITDFGIARITFEPTLTADGQIFGTPSYMSPEQVTGKSIDARSDIFSLGVMLYEMVTGRKPFVGDSVITITYNIVNMNPSPLGGMPPAVENVIRRAMRKNPQERFGTAAEMAREIQAAMGQARSLPAAMPRPFGPPTQVVARPQYPPAAPSGPAGGGYRAGTPPAQRAIPRPTPQPLFSPGTGPALPPHRAGMPPRSRMPAAGMPSPGMPAAAAPMLPAPVSSAQPYLPPPPPLVSAETRWFLGWLAVAVVVAVILLFVVYSLTTSSVAARPAGQGAASAGGPLTTQAQQAMQTNDWFKAWHLYKEAGDKGEGPRDLDYWNAAVCAVNWGMEQTLTNPAEAERACQEARQLAPNYGEASHALGRLALQQNKTAVALAAYDEAIAAWQRRLAQPGLSDADRDMAQKMLRDTQVDQASVLLEYARTLKQDNQLELAREAFQKAAAAAPNSDPGRQAKDELQGMGPGGAPGP